MTSLKGSAVEPASRGETICPSSVSVLAAGERHAPIAELSAAKRAALVACFNAGGLNKKDGAWHGALGGKPISGITTADLAREGMRILVQPGDRSGLRRRQHSWRRRLPECGKIATSKIRGTPQTVWLPKSSAPVLQHPSR